MVTHGIQAHCAHRHASVSTTASRATNHLDGTCWLETPCRRRVRGNRLRTTLVENLGERKEKLQEVISFACGLVLHARPLKRTSPSRSPLAKCATYRRTRHTASARKLDEHYETVNRVDAHFSAPLHSRGAHDKIFSTHAKASLAHLLLAVKEGARQLTNRHVGRQQLRRRLR